MELMYKSVIAIGILVTLVASGIVFLLGRRKKDVYSEGVRAANTSKIRETELYKKLSKIYLSLRIVLVAALVCSIIASLVLVARPFKTEESTTEIRKRDIIICLDVSYSLYDLNSEMTDYLKKLVRGLEGDRIGISIFNTSSVTYVPLTDDYDYVEEMLDDLSEYFVLQRSYYEDYIDNPDFSYFALTDEEQDAYDELREKLDYYDAGTLYNAMTRGSSLIGEGLASALYSFPYLDDSERTRVIIMVTDNELNAYGKQIVNLKEASELCSKNKVTLFGIFPSEEKFYDPEEYNYASCLNEFKGSVERTGGKFYVRTSDNSVQDIVQNIQKQEAMLVKIAVSTQTKDLPEKPFIALLLCLLIGCGAGLVLHK